ncbi:MAG: replication-relaxation family protein [Anaerolineae bacterium]
MQLTQRDEQLLHLLYEHRFLRTDQLLALSYAFAEPYTEQTLWRRLRKLSEHSYVEKLAQRQQGRTVYCLGKQGAKHVAASRGLPLKQIAYSSNSGIRFLAHKLGIADVRTALTVACLRSHNRQCDQPRLDQRIEWVSELELSNQAVQVQTPHGESLPLNPDGFVIFPDPRGNPSQCFVEVDLGTEPLGVFKDKVVAYQHYRSGFPQCRSALSSTVLTVAHSAERMESLLVATEDVGGDEQFAFTTCDELTPETFFDGIWRVAGLRTRTTEEVGERTTVRRHRPVAVPVVTPSSPFLTPRPVPLSLSNLSL